MEASRVFEYPNQDTNRVAPEQLSVHTTIRATARFQMCKF
jgi:hypothetical protein